MAFGPVDVVHWVAGYDLAGAGAVSTVQSKTEAKTAAVQLVGPLGAVDHEEPTGKGGWSMTERGYLDPEAMSLRKLFLAGAPAQPWPSILGREGAALGARVEVVSAVGVASRSIETNPDDFSFASLDYYPRGSGAAVHNHAALLAGGQRVRGPIVRPYAEFRIDQGAEGDSGAAFCIMLDDIQWDGATAVSATVRGSANGNAGAGDWADIQPSLDLAPPAVRGARYLTTSGIVRRYIGIDLTWTGGANPSAKVIAAFEAL